VDIENQYYNAKGAQAAPSVHARGGSDTLFCSTPLNARRRRATPRAPLTVLTGSAARREPALRRVGVALDGRRTYALVAGLLESADPKDALAGFAGVIQMEKEKGEWCGVAASLRPRRSRFAAAAPALLCASLARAVTLALLGS